MRALVTGGTGFVGRAVVPRLAHAGVTVRLALRGPLAPGGAPLSPVEMVEVGDLGSSPAWTDALRDVDAVVHLAARVHRVRDTAADPLAEARRVNTDATVALARAAAAAGARRFVFVSTVKVHGERGHFSERDAMRPVDAYARSKAEAEEGLRTVAAATGLEVVVIRPPLVHGPGARANLATLARAIARGIPLPLGAVRANRRSVVGVDNLADLLATALVHPAAHAGAGAFLASDGEDVSTADLARRLGAAMGRRARLVPVPAPVLRAAGALLGRRDAIERLTGSLTVDITRARDVLGWTPPVPLDEGLRRAVGGVP